MLLMLLVIFGCCGSAVIFGISQVLWWCRSKVVSCFCHWVWLQCLGFLFCLDLVS